MGANNSKLQEKVRATGTSQISEELKSEFRAAVKEATLEFLKDNPTAAEQPMETRIKNVMNDMRNVVVVSNQTTPPTKKIVPRWDQMTEAEFQELTKKVRLTELEVVPISRKCDSQFIHAMCRDTTSKKLLLYSCCKGHIHGLDSKFRETVELEVEGNCKHIVESIDGRLLFDGDIIYDKNTKAQLKKLPIYYESEYVYPQVKFSHCSAYYTNKGQLIRLFLDTLEEAVLLDISPSVFRDFLVDERETITYLTKDDKLVQRASPYNEVVRSVTAFKGNYLFRAAESMYIAIEGKTLRLSDLKSYLHKYDCLMLESRNRLTQARS